MLLEINEATHHKLEKQKIQLDISGTEHSQYEFHLTSLHQSLASCRPSFNHKIAVKVTPQV